MEKITYGFYRSQFGEMIIAHSKQGLSWLGFMVDGYKGNGYERMVKHFYGSEFVKSDVSELGYKIIAVWDQGGLAGIELDLRGSEFQKAVWLALLKIKKGEVKSYGDVAEFIGKPKAVRAVGSAVGANPVSLIVPCHRVVQKSGAIGNYGWGVDLKRKILCAEGLSF